MVLGVGVGVCVFSSCGVDWVASGGVWEGTNVGE